MLALCAWESLGFRAAPRCLLLSPGPGTIRGPSVQETSIQVLCCGRAWGILLCASGVSALLGFLLLGGLSPAQ